MRSPIRDEIAATCGSEQPDFRSDWSAPVTHFLGYPQSSLPGGRLHVGIPGRLRSEFAAMPANRLLCAAAVRLEDPQTEARQVVETLRYQVGEHLAHSETVARVTMSVWSDLCCRIGMKADLEKLITSRFAPIRPSLIGACEQLANAVVLARRKELGEPIPMSIELAQGREMLLRARRGSSPVWAETALPGSVAAFRR